MSTRPCNAFLGTVNHRFFHRERSRESDLCRRIPFCFFRSGASYKASGAISTPFGQASVPASMKNFLNIFGFFNGSNTGPLNHWDTSMCFSVPSLNRAETMNP